MDGTDGCEQLTVSGLFVHRATRAEPLVEEMADLLRGSRSDPFIADVVAVPTRGVERWITQRLADRLGVSAGIEFCSPDRLVGRCLAATGIDPHQTPWDPDRLVFPLMAAIDRSADDPDAMLLRRSLRGVDGPGPARPGRRWATARAMADRFSRYGTERPDLLRGWAGLPVPPGACGLEVPDDLAWQERLFDWVRQDLDEPFPAAVTSSLAGVLRQDPRSVDLPDVVNVFGPTRLPQAHLEVLLALAGRRQVHLWLVHPSPALWATVTVAGPAPGVPRRDDPTVDLVRHPLLASWGRDCREMQINLLGRARAAGVPVTDVVTPHPSETGTRLQALQRCLAADEPQDIPAPPGDRTVTVHACHGPARQVEVLREELLRLLSDDPTLQPRDIVVMCPDVETYAPLLAAAFGLADTLDGLDAAGWDVAEQVTLHPGHQLRIRIADRSLHRTNPVLGVLATLLDLADRRITVAQLLDLAGLPAVRRRFGWSEDDLERLGRWAEQAGVRWGLGPEHRGMFGVGGVPHNTWSAGLDRLLVGVAMPESGGYLGTGLPLDEVDTTEIDLAGRLAEFVSRLEGLLRAASHPHPLSDWVRLLTGAVTSFTDVSADDAWMLSHADHILSGIAADAGQAATGVPLTVADIRQLVADRFAARPTTAGFRTGDLTVCTLAPMRSVPHRVLALLGMDDGAFPRRVVAQGEDILLRDPLVGERDRAGEDRQLLLDAVMAATGHLLVLYTGADEFTGRRRPPAVPVAELLDALGGVEALTEQGVVVEHPLQPFDERNFAVDAPASFDRLAHDAALVRREVAREAAASMDLRGIPPLAEHEEVVDLEDLVAFLISPPRAFLRHRLGLRLWADRDPVSEQIPLDVDPLTEWGIADRMLTGLLDGVPLEAVSAYERRRGALPPAGLGTAVLERVTARVGRLHAAMDEVIDLDPRTEVLRLDLPTRPGETPMVLSGTAVGLRGKKVFTVTPSRLGAHHRIRSWVTTLAMAATGARADWQGITLGRAEAGDSLRMSRMIAPEPQEAAQRLAELVRLRRLGLDTVLPLPLRTGARYAEGRASGADPGRSIEEAASAWTDGRYPGEQSGPEFAAVWGRVSLSTLARYPVPLETLLDPRMGRDEAGAFGRLARHVWGPLLDAEETSLR